MKKFIRLSLMALCLFSVAQNMLAQVGNPYIHDPSTIVECDGKYYTMGTRGGGLISEDGWHWYEGAVRPGAGVAPDIIKLGDRYLVVWAVAPDDGEHLQYKTTIYGMWNKTLDPYSRDFEYSEPFAIVGTNGHEDCDAIDPGLMMGPDGRLWMVYGTYFGYTRVVELDPKTALPIAEPVDVALSCEAGQLIYEDGWYYLLATHGSCCAGANSRYEIIAGRSKSPTGPYYDNIGRDMIHGGGRLVLASEHRRIGAGHFGRNVLEKGVQKMSLHFEGDLDRSGRSVLAIRPIIWKNGWPVAGKPIEEGNYSIASERRGFVLELTVNDVPMPGGMRGLTYNGNEPEIQMEDQKLEDVIGGWDKGNIPVRAGAELFRPHQEWVLTEVDDAGGYLGGAYYKITIAGTERALCATADKEVTTVPVFTGASDQLWQIDQLTDGTYRIMPKRIPGTDEKLVLVSVGDSTPSLGVFDFDDDNCKWNLNKH